MIAERKTKDSLQDDALKIALNHRQCSLSLSMGSGKTLIGLKYIESHYTDSLRVLVVVPKRKVMDTWLEEADKHNKAFVKDHIDFVTYISLHKVDKEYDIVILDECHNLLDSHRGFLSRHEGYILGLSGTMPKYQNSEKGKMVDEYCPTVYWYTTDDAVDDQMLNNYRIVVHKLPLGQAKTIEVKQRSGKSFYTSEVANYEYWTSRVYGSRNKKEQQITRVMRMRALMGFKTKEIYAKKLLDTIEDKVILFANTQEQADRLCSHTVHSGNPDSEQNFKEFAEGNITKLGAVQQLNEGINIPDLRQAIVMHTFSGSSPKTSQKLGRLLRLKPGEEGILHILVYKDCIDENWADSMLSGFESSRITYKDIKTV